MKKKKKTLNLSKRHISKLNNTWNILGGTNVSNTNTNVTDTNTTDTDETEPKTLNPTNPNSAAKSGLKCVRKANPVLDPDSLNTVCFN